MASLGQVTSLPWASGLQVSDEDTNGSGWGLKDKQASRMMPGFWLEQLKDGVDIHREKGLWERV